MRAAIVAARCPHASRVAEPRSTHDEPPVRVLLLGGSQGAEALNRIMPDALALVRERLPGRTVSLTHQAGEHNIETARERYAGANDVNVLAYLDDMAEAYAQTDLAVCRAGAMTVSELAAVGVASVLIPYPYAVDDHQTANGRYLADADAAVLIPESEFDAERLADEMARLISAPRRLAEMGRRARELGFPDATEKVAAVCEEVAHA